VGALIFSAHPGEFFPNTAKPCRSSLGWNIVDAFLPAGAGLMFVLGLRHGLDPDHIAAIDGMTMHVLRTRSGAARWVGTLFSLGHGTVVTGIAVGVGLASRDIMLPRLLAIMAGWLPIALLTLIGLSNLRTLLAQPDGTKSRWSALRLAGPLARSGHPAGIFLVGVIFALVFDTASQAAAWGLAATVQGGTAAALTIGVVFTLGMVVTDTVDSRVVAGILQRAAQADVRRFRRLLAWCIVATSLGMAAYGIATRINPALSVGDSGYSTIGLVLFAPFALGYIWMLWRMLRRTRLNGSTNTAPSRKV